MTPSPKKDGLKIGDIVKDSASSNCWFRITGFREDGIMAISLDNGEEWKLSPLRKWEKKKMTNPSPKRPMTMRQFYKASVLKSGKLPANLHLNYPEDREEIAQICGALADAMLAEDLKFEKRV